MSKILTRIIFVIIFISLLVGEAGCSFFNPVSVPEPTPVLMMPTALAIPTGTPTSAPTFTVTVVPTLFQTKTPEPTLVPTPWLKKQGPGRVICPILLYHRIATPKGVGKTGKGTVTNPYYVPPEEFRAQLQALKEWGYVTITVSNLVDAIKLGRKLPARPIIISFDDGDETVYTQAFPIMREFGFTGINYLVTNYVGTQGYMSVDQLKELSAAGWEVGSHSVTHSDLTSSKFLEFEIVHSRRNLEKMLGVPVRSFAYPFGQTNLDLKFLVSRSYQAGMGLGVFLAQRPVDIFYLWRRPVEMGWDVNKFGSFLPWNSVP
jgi:peptidoglycan/xylan/chitin deacetylase (PgdA/CDA1 family)